MTKLQYTKGRSFNRRLLSGEDLARIMGYDQESEDVPADLIWGPDTDHVAEVPNAIAEKLLEQFPDEFVPYSEPKFEQAKEAKEVQGELEIDKPKGKPKKSDSEKEDE